FEAPDVQRDVVVDEKDRSGAVGAGVADVREHPVERERVEIAPAHLDDGAEATVEGAAPRGLDDVDLAPHPRVAPEYPRGPVREPDLAARQARDRPVGVVDEVVA